MVVCRDCGGKCWLLKSKTPRNPGRKFWSCPAGCKVWNGWAAADAEDSSSSSSEELERAPKKIKAKAKTKASTCARCSKALDMSHEVDNHIRRYSETMPYAVALRGELGRELIEAAASGKYTCEKCLRNE
jgi:hypothetical protein